MSSFSKVPRHVAFIMDGNRRWARKKNLGEAEGHRKGREAIKPLIRKGLDLGIEAMTFWAFSTKNFKRDREFLTNLFGVFRETLGLQSWFDEITEAGGEIRVIGDLSGFPSDIVKGVQGYLDRSTPQKRKMVVNFALGYEGRDEIVRGIKKWKEAGADEEGLTVETFGEYLDTSGLPDPDLLVRTGGDVRISGFLLWQLADTELYFCDTLWPDFEVGEFEKALVEYECRDRRFGK